MIVIGFILIAAAVAAGVILIAQNRGAIDVHALGGTWHLDAYWLTVAGLVILAVAILGLAIAKTAAAHVWRFRTGRSGHSPGKTAGAAPRGGPRAPPRRPARTV